MSRVLGIDFSTVAFQRRSNMRHLVHPDGLATYCGRILHRRSWQTTQGRVCDCRRCLAIVARSSPKK